MSFAGSYVHRLGVLGACLLVLSASSGDAMGDSADTARAWQDFGMLLLSRLGTGRCLSTGWLDRELDVVDPRSGEAVRTAELILMKAFHGYGQDTIAIEGRIRLDVNPQCILGLYTAERFPGTKLGNWGRGQFERCIEHGCLVAMPEAGNTWHAKLEAELLTVNASGGDLSKVGEFAWTEIPYLYLYVISKAPSADVQHQARRCLAQYLWERYALEPGLRQYLALFEHGYSVDSTWFSVAMQLDQSGSHQTAKKLYRQLLRNLDSAKGAKEASEKLARILMAESRQREAKMALSALFERFPNVECTAPDVRGFWKDYHINREETSGRLIQELTKTTRESQMLLLYRHLDALWTLEEAPQHWQVLVHGAEPGSPAEQLGRVFLARALLDAGKIDASQEALGGLAESVNPFVQAQGLAALAEVAEAKGNLMESVRLYFKAIRIDRPTSLPSWWKGLVQIPSLDDGTPARELRAWMLFLRGCSSLISGDFAAAVDSLARLAPDSDSLPASVQGALPCAMMLAYLGIGDSSEAEAWGHQIFEERRKADPNDRQVIDLLTKIQSLDTLVCQVAAQVRATSADSSVASTVLEQAMRICNTGAMLDPSKPRAEAKWNEVQQLYARAKRRHVAQLLTAEYHYTRQQRITSGAAGQLPSCEPIFFAAQVLGGESVDRIRENLVSMTKDEGGMDPMYRFALFALKVNQPELARVSLDTAAGEKISPSSLDVLKDITTIYLAASDYEEAIDTYKMIAGNSRDPNTGQSAELDIIDLYAEKLKDYDKAVQGCEEFLRKYPGAPQTSQLEFLLGRLAYLKKDYAGAVGQLDGFQKKYPGHSQEGQAMVLAGLSRMGEGNTKEAIVRFREIIRRFPDEDLAARSKFLIGYAQLSEQQYSAAAETLKQLIEQFPHSQYVTQAQTLIDRLNKVSK